MAEILKNDLVIELLTKDGTPDSTVSAPFLRAGDITFTGDSSLAIRNADCFKLEENFVVTEGENSCLHPWSVGVLLSEAAHEKQPRLVAA